jgi:hypothetical protein
MPPSARPPGAEWHIAGMHARPYASVGRTQARLARRLRDTGETERVGRGASRPSRVWRTERRVVGPGQLRGNACWHPEHRTTLPQPTVATQPLLQRRRAAVERLAIEPLQRHMRAEMRDQPAQATDRGQSPTCGCGADDSLKLQPSSSCTRFGGSPVFQSMTRAAFPVARKSVQASGPETTMVQCSVFRDVPFEWPRSDFSAPASPIEEGYRSQRRRR